MFAVTIVARLGIHHHDYRLGRLLIGVRVVGLDGVVKRIRRPIVGHDDREEVRVKIAETGDELRMVAEGKSTAKPAVKEVISEAERPQRSNAGRDPGIRTSSRTQRSDGRRDTADLRAHHHGCGKDQKRERQTTLHMYIVPQGRQKVASPRKPVLPGFQPSTDAPSTIKDMLSPKR